MADIETDSGVLDPHPPAVAHNIAMVMINASRAREITVFSMMLKYSLQDSVTV
jgi:hypothetical protein